MKWELFPLSMANSRGLTAWRLPRGLEHSEGYIGQQCLVRSPLQTYTRLENNLAKREGLLCSQDKAS